MKHYSVDLIPIPSFTICFVKVKGSCDFYNSFLRLFLDNYENYRIILLKSVNNTIQYKYENFLDFKYNTKENISFRNKLLNDYYNEWQNIIKGRFYGLLNGSYKSYGEDIYNIFEIKNVHRNISIGDGLTKCLSFTPIYAKYSNIIETKLEYTQLIYDLLFSSDICIKYSNTKVFTYLFVLYSTKSLPKTFDMKKSSILLVNKRQISISIMTKQYLSTPYRSHCSDYQTKYQLYFNSTSYDKCIRKCVIVKCLKLFNCQVRELFDLSTDEDEKINGFEYCSQINNSKCIDIQYNLEIMCRNICPYNCRDDYFNIVDSYFSTFPNHNYLQIYLDKKQPVIVQQENELQTLESLLCYLGGLYGMWFGVSVYSIKQLFTNNFHTYILIIFNIALDLSLKLVFLLIGNY